MAPKRAPKQTQSEDKTVPLELSSRNLVPKDCLQDSIEQTSTLEMPATKRRARRALTKEEKEEMVLKAKEDADWEPWYSLFGVRYATWNKAMKLYLIDWEAMYMNVVHRELGARHFIKQYLVHKCRRSTAELKDRPYAEH